MSFVENTSCPSTSCSSFIEVVGARENNLKNFTIKIPKNKFIVITGPSGSGKSSLAFSTIYAEGQARYVESLSPYARQFLNLQNKPDVDCINGLSPAIAIEQKTTNKNPRSTVATVTEIYDYIRLLFARIGVPYSPITNKPIHAYSVSQMVCKIVSIVPMQSKIYVLAPFVTKQKNVTNREFIEIKKRGFTRVRIDGVVYRLDNLPRIDHKKEITIDILVDRLVIEHDIDLRLSQSLETALLLGGGTVYIQRVKEKEDTTEDNDSVSSDDMQDSDQQAILPPGEVMVLSSKFSCPVSGFTIDEIEPRIFSFNTPHGACTHCGGLGKQMAISLDLVVSNESLSIADGAITPWNHNEQRTSTSRYYNHILRSVAKHYGFSIETPWNKLSKEIHDIILYGSGNVEIQMIYEENRVQHSTKQVFIGVIPFLEKQLSSSEGGGSTTNAAVSRYQSMQNCVHCKGHRLKSESLAVKINKHNIGEVTAMSVVDAFQWFTNLPDMLSEQHAAIAEIPLKEIVRRLNFLIHVGLDYLCLNRESHTLSGGESQRIRLASQIGSGLSGVIYVLDEPSIGLHQRDNCKLLLTLQNLRDLGNTVIVVEHDEDTMRHADHVIDIGPEAGDNGGYVIAQGSPKDIIDNKDSVTGQFLGGTRKIPIPQTRSINSDQLYLEIIGARSNNLKNIDVRFPLGKFICVTGVSGSGKSTLIMKTLCAALLRDINKSSVIPGLYESINGMEHINKIIEIDQSPIGRTPLSNAATYTGVFKTIRDLFASLPEAKARGYTPGRFSFNTKGGRCEACTGDGVIKIEMHFLPDVYVKCDQCAGKRYNRETLEILYKNKSIADVLNMSTDEAAEFFKNVPVILEKMSAMQEVGLGYINIGLSATMLSGGEAQRIKLSKELSKRSTGKTLYILDEPTTGLHTSDINNLLNVLHKLVDSGNTVIVVEHNLEFIKTADYIVDIGPHGGTNGGKVVCTGSPKEICRHPDSITGKFLKTVMSDVLVSAESE